MSKTVLVIGGAGFIGSNLCKQLVSNSDYEVYSLDNYFTGSKTNHHPGVTYIHGEAKDITTIMESWNIDSVDLVFHFGEYSRVEQSFEDLQFVFQMNQQMIHVLEFCRHYNAKLIYSGSSTKFSPEGKALSPYAWTKATNTDLLKSYAQWYGLDYAIVYFYNVYGPGEISEGKYATLIAKFQNLKDLGKPLTVVEPGTQQRNFTYIGDVVEALELVSKQGSGDGYGIGSDETYTVLDVAQSFSHPIEWLPPREGNRMSAELVTDKTKALGWNAKQNVLTYIQSMNKSL